MKRGLLTLAVLGAWCGIGLSHASAQFGTLGQAPARTRPTVSPYINMQGAGATGYYGLVKPQTDATRAIQQLQQNMGMLNPDGSLKGQLDNPNPITATTGLQTGHVATFFNYGHYYPLTPAGSSSSNLGNTIGFGTGIGTGLGGYNPYTNSGYGIGNNAPRVFYGGNMNQGIRP